MAVESNCYDIFLESIYVKLQELSGTATMSTNTEKLCCFYLCSTFEINTVI